MPKKRRPRPSQARSVTRPSGTSARSLRAATDRPARRHLIAFPAWLRRPKWLRLPAWQRATWRLVAAGGFLAVSVVLLAVGTVLSYATDDVYWINLLGIAIPSELVFVFAAWYGALSWASALHRVRPLRFDRWPRILRRLLVTALAFVCGTLALALYFTSDASNVPVGPIILAVMVVAVTAADFTLGRRNRAATRK